MIQTTTIEAEARSLSEQAADVVVTDAPSYESAGAFLKAIKLYRQRVAETFDPHIKAAHENHKALVAEKRKHDDAPAKAEEQVKQAMLTWQAAEQRRLDDERRAAEAEQRRLAEEQQLAEAAAAEAAGEDAAADAILEQPLMVAPPPVVRAAPRVAGVAVRETWDAEVTDLGALVRAVAAGKAPLALLQPNLTAIRAQARSLKGECRLPGVRVFSKGGMTVRA